MMMELGARSKCKMCLKITRRISNKFQVLIVVSSMIASNYLVIESDASIAMENVDIELSRTGPLMQFNATELLNQQAPGNSSTTSADQTMNFAESRTTTQSVQQIFDSKINSQPANAVPIYRSAPKQVEALDELGPSTNGGHLQKSPASQLDGNRKLLMKTQEENDDLNHAAAGHYKKHKKKKSLRKKKVKKIVKKKKKKKKVITITTTKKKKFVKIGKPVYHHHHREQHKRPKDAMKHKKMKYHHHHHHHPAPQFDYSKTPSMGKYYEYRIVPEKGSWKYGFKRGNDKHLIERNEYKHKSHFKGSFDWKDKMGRGKHLFDYNHAKSR